MHKRIERFGFDGEIGDSKDFIRLRSQYEAQVVDQMRSDGYVPVLDLGPLFSTKLNKKTMTYSFELTVYGVYVGKKKACNIEGMDGHGTFLLRPTRKVKSSPSSPISESQ